jgi:hypothetical protein
MEAQSISYPPEPDTTGSGEYSRNAYGAISYGLQIIFNVHYVIVMTL